VKVGKTYRIYNASKNEFMLGPRDNEDEARTDLKNLAETDGVSGRLELRAFEEGESPPRDLGRTIDTRQA
jgi:hypothetical protein